MGYGRHTTHSALKPDYSGEIASTLWSMKKRGLREATLSNVGKFLRVLDAGAELEDVESVKGFIASHCGSEGYKRNLVYAYDCYVHFKGLTWQRPVYYERAKLPKIPTEEKLNMIISASRLKLACMLSISKETGLRPIELVGLKLCDIDFEKSVIYPSTAKHGAPRVLKISERLVSMLKTYVAESSLGSQNRLFEMTSEEYAKHFRFVRNKLASKVGDPTIKMIRLYDLRHFFATTLYAKTKDILLVKQKMGHTKLETTLLYTQLLSFESDEYVCKVAESLLDAGKLVEAGFEFVTQFEGKMLFRKRK